MHFNVDHCSSGEEFAAAELRVFLSAAPAARQVRLQETDDKQTLNTTLIPAAGGRAVFPVTSAAAVQTGDDINLEMSQQTPAGQWRVLNVTDRDRFWPLLLVYCRD